MSNLTDTTRGLGFGGSNTSTVYPMSKDNRWEKTRDRYHKLFGIYIYFNLCICHKIYSHDVFMNNTWSHDLGFHLNINEDLP